MSTTTSTSEPAIATSRSGRTRRVLTLSGVDAVMDAALAAAQRGRSRVVIAVVDAGGSLLQLRRTPDAQVASGQVAIDKARTAAIFVRPSREIEEQVSAGRLGALALHGAAALTGGIPLRVGGEVVGAIGTSGETPDEDEAISLAGTAVDLETLPDATVGVPAMSQSLARRVAEAASAQAAARDVAPVVAVVDADGDLAYLSRPDAAQVASVGVATDKARTAAIFRRPSKDFEDQAAGGRPSALHLAGAVPLQGGIPLVEAGVVIGAIGVSGASSAEEDSELAMLGASAAQPGPAGETQPVAMFAAAAIAARFATGGLLTDTGGYALDAGRRSAAGEAECHGGVADIMRVESGTATVVTGGRMVEPREVGPGEWRAPQLDGGTRHDLRPGDALAIPAGVPHQFVAVDDPFLYFVVKVRAGSAPAAR